MLTDDDRLHLVFAPQAGPEWITDLLLRISQLSLEVRRIRRAHHRRDCLEILFVLARELMLLLGAQRNGAHATAGAPDLPFNASGTPASEEVRRQQDNHGACRDTSGRENVGSSLHQHYERRLADLRSFYEQASQRQAIADYFAGMAWGVLAMLACAAVASVALWALGWIRDDRAYVQLNLQLMVLGAGGIGAVVSVMQRTMSRQLTLGSQDGRLLLGLMGAFRPLVGATLASVVSLLFQSGLLAIAVPTVAGIYSLTTGVRLFAYFAVVAFLGGFSERWAQDMLTLEQGSLTGPQPALRPDGSEHQAGARTGGGVT